MKQLKTLRNGGISNKGKFRLTLHGKRTKAYSVWYSMLDRCYVENKNQPTYIPCSVVEPWLSFQNFASWFYKNYQDGQHLDKDILTKGNSVYGPATCCFVPQEINNLLTDRSLHRGDLPQGVSRVSTPTETYQSHLSQKGKLKHLGSFKSTLDAYEAYKKAKEDYVKEVAKEHFAQGNIDLITYKALLKWEV